MKFWIYFIHFVKLIIWKHAHPDLDMNLRRFRLLISDWYHFMLFKTHTHHYDFVIMNWKVLQFDLKLELFSLIFISIHYYSRSRQPYGAASTIGQNVAPNAIGSTQTSVVIKTDYVFLGQWQWLEDTNFVRYVESELNFLVRFSKSISC